MTGLDNTNQQNDTPNVQALGNSMSTALQKFAQCNHLRNDNGFISGKIREIKEQSENFRKYADESIIQSEKLSKYAEEVVVFAVACADPSFTKEELLEFLKLTLEDAKNNKVEAEKLKANISGIMAELTNIQNECVQYSGDIQNNARMIRSKVVDELENKEFKQKFFNATYKVGIGAAILGTVVSILAAPITAGASLAAIPVIDEGALILAGTSGAIAFGSKVASNRENNDIAVLNKQLIIERDELNSRIDLLNKDLNSIVNESCDILCFWDEQITSLKELVEKLERYDNQDGERPSRLVALTIQKKWNNVNRECKEYNRIVRAALQTSNMAISN